MLGPRYFHAKPVSLKAVDTSMLRALHPYSLLDLDWSSLETNSTILSPNPKVSISGTSIPWFEDLHPRLGPMTPTILDMASLFMFRPHGVNTDLFGEYKRRGRKVKTWIRPTKKEILRNRKYFVFIESYPNMLDKEQGHEIFLLFWLKKFIFPCPEGFVTGEYMYLAEALYNEDNVSTCLFMLASIYHYIYQITTKSMDLDVCGPI
ncbi:hypothetical protein L3X38_022392 [Prunus dulcis]|uniref:Aminotransferase-like plant mobile domain-containing protein n=1 Tax=Prunus dulcis TaxID=3755 RepID=A0AAD4VX35_PRUDU|nr:hypothetical protein L3X38_022392 [Prunus dulcis]